MKPPHSSCPPTPRRAAFSLIELIGVLAVLAILAATMVPNLVRKIAEARASKEQQNLLVLKTGLESHVRDLQSIPGGGTWVASLAEATGLNETEVTWVDTANTNSSRVFLIHPSFTPSTGSDPVFTTTTGGGASPTNARIMIISSTQPNLTLPVTSGKAADTAPNRTAFENIWNWNYSHTTEAPPTGWPASWNNNGKHLHVVRINLAPLFHRVTFSNLQFPTNYPFAQFNGLGTIAFATTNAVDGYYLEGTMVRLYKHDSPYGGPPASPDDQDLAHTVEADVNFLYSGSPGQWIIP